MVYTTEVFTFNSTILYGPYVSVKQHHGLPHYKCVLSCCEKCHSISIPCLESNNDATNTFQQYIFLFAAMYRILIFMTYAHMKKEQYILCVPLVLVL